MKVLLLNDMGAPHGGAERLTLALREGLRARGHDARLLASSAPSEVGPNEADYPCFGTISGLRTLNRVINVDALLQLRRVLGDFQPDVVHVRMFLSQLSPLILQPLHRVPVLYHATWNETICPTGLKMLPDGSPCRDRAGLVCVRAGCLSRRAFGPLMFQLHLFRRFRASINLIVANSAAMRARLIEQGIGPVEVLWNGVPVAAQRGPLDGPPTVTCAGRLTWEKGLDVVIRAFALVVKALPEARLLVAGAGPEREPLQGLIHELGLESRVVMLGQMKSREMESAFQSGWVHAVPSRVEESFGLTAAEAMMRGTAVVGSASGGLAEIIVDGETGLLTPSDDAPELARVLLLLLADRSRAETMGSAARRHALRQMNVELWVDRFVDYYQGLVADAR